MNGRAAVLLVALLVGALGFGFFKLALAPRYDERAALDEKIAAQQQAATDAQAQLGAARAARDAYPANSAALVELGTAVPADPDVGALIFQLQSEARRAGVSLKTYTRNQEVADESTTGPAGVTRIPVQLTLSGDFFGLDRLLRRIRSFVSVDRGRAGIRGRLLVVDSLDLSPTNADEPGADQLTATLGVTAFVRADGAAPADADAAAAATPSATAAPTTATAPAQGNDQ